MGVVVLRMCCPTDTRNKVCCGVGSVVQWPCSMCVQCRHVRSVCSLWMGCGLPVAMRHLTENRQ